MATSTTTNIRHLRNIAARLSAAVDGLGKADPERREKLYELRAVYDTIQRLERGIERHKAKVALKNARGSRGREEGGGGL